MPKRDDKPTKDEILKQFEFCKKYYSKLRTAYERDEEFYNLEFKGRLNIPGEFRKDRVVLPTARDVVDTGINHTNIFNARVFTNKKGTSEIATHPFSREIHLAVYPPTYRRPRWS